MKKFWNWIRDESGERVLRLEGPIDEDYFWGDEMTPRAFREDLEAGEGDVTVWVNSPGGNVFAAAEIYTMLRDYKGKVTVKIDAIAASAASVVAMAGDTVLMSPVAMLMIHDPMTFAMGNAADMEKAINTLNEVKESIINAYQAKSGLSRNKIAKLMSDETWMNAKKAVEMGFADEILFAKKSAGKTGTTVEPEEGDTDPENKLDTDPDVEDWQPYSTRVMDQIILNRLGVFDTAADTPAILTDSTAPATPTDSTDSTDEADEGTEETTDTTEDEPTTPVEETETSDEETQPADEEIQILVENTEHTHPTVENAPPLVEVINAPPMVEEISVPPVVEEISTTSVVEEKLPVVEEKLPVVEEKLPVIGMDGKTKDGSMPFDLLMKQLEFLK